MTINVKVSSFAIQFNETGVGSRVLDRARLIDFTSKRLETYKFPVEGDDNFVNEGEGVMPLNEALETVGSGTASRADCEEADIFPHVHRDVEEMFASRDKACKAEGLSMVMYTWANYSSNNGVKPEEKLSLAEGEEPTHIIVAVLASAGPDPQVSEVRFLANLEGGKYDNMSFEEQDVLADKVIAYNEKWITVCDR
jgi:hypothetical protein